MSLISYDTATVFFFDIQRNIFVMTLAMRCSRSKSARASKASSPSYAFLELLHYNNFGHDDLYDN
jgi:hypothetical protein